MLNNRKARRRAEALSRKDVAVPKIGGSTSSGHMRSAMLGSAAAGALMMSMPTLAFAQTVVPPTGGPCVVVGTVATCTGDVSAGVMAGAPLDTLNVNNLTQAIMPAAGVDGIDFQVGGGNNITINSNTGTFGITTTGGAQGIDARIQGAGGDGNITIINTGNISSERDGIQGDVGDMGNIVVTNIGNISANRDGIDVENDEGVITVNQTGNINARDEGIRAYIDGTGSISITSMGNITSTQGDGIFADIDDRGDITVKSTGNIVADETGIHAENDTGTGVSAVTVTSVGNITAGEHGIYAYNDGDGTVNVTSTGTINAGYDAIYTYLYEEGNISVISNGDLTAGQTGIYADQNEDGNVTITTTGNITAGDDGIEVDHDEDGNVTISSAGNITADSYGIEVDLDGGGVVTITSVGNIVSNFEDGISVDVEDASTVTITSTGNIDAGGNGNGIFVDINDDGGAITVTSTGNIIADSEGIDVEVDGDGTVTVTSTGNITAGSQGIEAQVDGDGTVTVTSVGNITADEEGIYAYVDGDGNVTVTSTGNVVSNNSKGIYAYVDGDGDVTVTSTGNIKADEHGIYAAVDDDGNVTVTSVGDIEAGDYGIFADIDNGMGNITVSSTGNITGDDGGIYAQAETGGMVSITSTGNITTTDGPGIYAFIDDADAAVNTVTVVSTGNISTMGDDAHGIYTYIDDGTTNNGVIAVTSTGNITTTGNDADGIFAYVKHAGTVTVSSTGNITTSGDDAHGIYAWVDGGTSTVTSMGDITTSGEGSFGIYAGAYDGGTASITQTGNITTTGDDSFGIYAYIDNGPGELTINVNGNITTSGEEAFGIHASVRDDGKLAITHTGDIVTTGDSALGIYAYVNDGAGDAMVTVTGNITTSGDEAHGVYAFVRTGTTTVTITGDVTINGNDADGIRNFSYTDYASVTNINDGTIQGGGGLGAAINFSGQANGTNTLNTSGVVTLSSLGGTAILGGDGNTTVNNSGTLNTITNGKIDLGAGANAFNNLAGGTFNSGAEVIVGAGNLFTNAGTLSPGGEDAVSTTAVTGNFIQTGSGVLFTDVDSTAKTADLTTITGTASVAGNVKVKIANPALGAQKQTILSATGGTTDNGLGLIASPVLQAALEYPNANDVVLSTDINFAAPGLNLNANQNSLGGALNGVVGAGSGALSPLVLALLNDITTEAEYTAALNQLGTEIVLNGAASAAAGAQNFANQLFSCQVNGVQYAAIAEGSCIWVRPQVRHTETDNTFSNIGFEDTAGGASIGGQSEYQPGWFLGGALGIEYGSTDNNAGASIKRTTVNGGLSIKHVDGPWALSAAVFGGSMNFNSERNINFGGFAATNNAKFNARYFGGQVRAAYLVEFNPGYVKPLIDFNVTHLNVDGSSETGTAATALTTNGYSQTYFSVSPALEFGTDYQLENAYTARFYGKVGATISGNDNTTVTARFTNAPGNSGSFSASSSTDNVFGNVEIGVTLFNQEQTTIQLGYQGSFSENTRSHGGFAKAMFKF